MQDEPGLPAPATAVSGVSAYQVWFSLQAPLPVAQATDFLVLLRLRYLADVAPRQVLMWPAADACGQIHHVRPVPALRAETGYWSAFVAPGLLSMFANEPWLDLPPGADAQAKLLANFESIQPAGFRQARQRLQPPQAAVAPEVQVARVDTHRPPRAHEGADPMDFLLSVMPDPATDLGLRIEAAKALLPYCTEPGRG